MSLLDLWLGRSETVPSDRLRWQMPDRTIGIDGHASARLAEAAAREAARRGEHADAGALMPGF